MLTDDGKEANLTAELRTGNRMYVGICCFSIILTRYLMLKLHLLWCV